MKMSFQWQIVLPYGYNRNKREWISVKKSSEQSQLTHTYSENQHALELHVFQLLHWMYFPFQNLLCPFRTLCGHTNNIQLS